MTRFPVLFNIGLTLPIKCFHTFDPYQNNQAMSKQVIRVEHPADGKGLWRSVGDEIGSLINNHTKYEVICSRHSDATKFPSLWDDAELYEIAQTIDDISQYFFAFKSLEQLATALTKDEIKECINDLGFRILMLTVTDYHESNFQVIFKKESIVDKDDITFMFL